jgi:hypothetical protein
MAKKTNKTTKTKKKGNRRRTGNDPISNIFNPLHLFLLFGIATFLEIMISLIYYISEQTLLAPVMYIGELGNFTEGENIIFFMIFQILGIWVGLWFVTAILKIYLIKNKK